MRVIAGEARGRPLRAPKNAGTRPTSDKIKGAIFAMIETALIRLRPSAEDPWGESRVLDLYAGSGGLGIEALSRGAAWVDFVERDREACEAIAANLKATGMANRAQIWRQSALTAMRNLQTMSKTYAIICADPPYADPGAPDVAAMVIDHDLIEPAGILVVEHSRRTPMADSLGDWRRWRARQHGETVVSVWLRADELAQWASRTETDEEERVP